MDMQLLANIKTKEMKFILNILAILVFINTYNLSAQYTVNDVFSDLNKTTHITDDIFAVWWDKDMNYAVEAEQLLTKVIGLKETILNDFYLQVPQSTLDSFYINIYLHDDGGFYDNFGWGNGVDTDSNGYPYLTLKYWIISDDLNTAHEVFHIFQHNSNSSGFRYEGDKNWYTEASAEWFAYLQNPNDTKSFATSQILSRLPHIPLWTGWFNQPASYPTNWQRENHQYALGQFIFYLSEEGNVSKEILAGCYYANISEVPQEYLFNNIGGDQFRTLFLDWATSVVNDFDFSFMSQAQIDNSITEWSNYADLSDNNSIVETFEVQGTNGWYRPENNKVTTGWSFNTYSIENPEPSSYSIELNGDQNGSFNSSSYFKAKISLRQSDGNSSTYDMQMTNEYQGSLLVDVPENTSELLVIIASMPETFEKLNSEFQMYSYELRINNTLSIIDASFNSDVVKIYPNPIKDILTINLNDKNDNLKVNVFDSLGKEIFSTRSFQDKNLAIDFSNLSNGIYFLHLFNDKKFSTFKLIK